MLYKVSPQSLSCITLNESNLVASILQNIAIILSTRQQTVPLYREFGLPGRFIDKPVSVARPMLVAEIHAAISEFEPRATLLNVIFEADGNTPGILIPVVEVEIIEQ